MIFCHEDSKNSVTKPTSGTCLDFTVCAVKSRVGTVPLLVLPLFPFIPALLLASLFSARMRSVNLSF